jgi:hypothetical protein
MEQLKIEIKNKREYIPLFPEYLTTEPILRFDRKIRGVMLYVKYWHN